MARGIAPSLIFGDPVLAEMVNKRPTTIEALLSIEGVTHHRADKYGAKTVALIAAFCAANQLQSNVGIRLREVSGAADSAADSSQQWRNCVTDTVSKSVDLFLAGKTVAQIRAERAIAESTGLRKARRS